MARGSRKRTAGDTPGRALLGDAPRRSGTRKSRRGSPKVVPLPRGRYGKPRATPRASRQAGRTVGRRRLRLVAGAVALVCISLGGRAVHLSMESDDRFAAAFASEQRLVATAEDRSERGAIFSADGRRLATSLDAAEVVATPYQIEDARANARALAGVLDVDAAQIEAKLTKRDGGGAPSGYSVVASGVEPEQAREVRDLSIPGVTVTPDAVRVYPNGALVSQLLGHLGEDKAYGGVEARYDETLKKGEDVTLTIDTAVQEELDAALIAAADEHGATSALGLVMRVEDGAIVAMSNVPGYDNNRFGEAADELQRNRTLTDPYEPGSTFKAFTTAAALEEEAVAEDAAFVVPDSIVVADRLIHDSQEHETKTLTTGDILVQSSNVGTIQVAQSLGGERLYEYIKRFGFGERTGVDLWGEDPGDVPPYEEWSGSSIGNIPIGQGLTVTPLQLAAGYAAIASGGLEVTPYVEEDAAPSGPGHRVISEGTSSIVRGMLRDVVENGSGERARVPGYTVAGKTGTAEKVDPETGLYGGGYVSSFIGFAPAEDPEYLALIVLDDPQTTYWGELTSAPAFAEVMDFTLKYFNVPPNLTEASPPNTVTEGPAQ